MVIEMDQEDKRREAKSLLTMMSIEEDLEAAIHDIYMNTSRKGMINEEQFFNILKGKILNKINEFLPENTYDVNIEYDKDTDKYNINLLMR